MNKWQELGVEKQERYFREAESRTGIVVNAIEKDWWVTTVLRALFSTGASKYLIFKGLYTAIHKPFYG